MLTLTAAAIRSKVQRAFARLDAGAQDVTWIMRVEGDAYDPVNGTVHRTQTYLTTRAFVYPERDSRRWVGGVEVRAGDLGIIFERRQLEEAAVAAETTFVPAPHHHLRIGDQEYSLRSYEEDPVRGTIQAVAKGAR